MEIPWEHQAGMLRSSAGGEELVERGLLRQLVRDFLELSPDDQRGVAIRVAGPDWTCEYIDEEIRDLATRPEYGGAPDQSESAPDAGAEALG